MLQAVLAVLPIEAAFRASLNNDPTQAGDIHRQIDALVAASGQGVMAQALAGDQLYPRVRSGFAIALNPAVAVYQV